MEASGERTRGTAGSSGAALRPEERGGAPPSSRDPIDLVVTSPTDHARQAAAGAVGDRWVFTLEEPLLAPWVG